MNVDFLVNNQSRIILKVWKPNSNLLIQNKQKSQQAKVVGESPMQLQVQVDLDSINITET